MIQQALAFDAPKVHLKDSALKVLRMLQSAGFRGVTSGEFANAFVLRYAARLAELRAAGYSWVKEPVPDSSQWRYTLQAALSSAPTCGLAEYSQSEESR